MAIQPQPEDMTPEDIVTEEELEALDDAEDVDEETITRLENTYIAASNLGKSMMTNKAKALILKREIRRIIDHYQVTFEDLHDNLAPSSD